MIEHIDVRYFLGMLVVMLGSAELAGAPAQRVGRPAVLGELMVSSSPPAAPADLDGIEDLVTEA